MNGEWKGWAFDKIESSEKEYYMMVCIAHFISVKINKYLFGEKTIKTTSNISTIKSLSSIKKKFLSSTIAFISKVMIKKFKIH